MNRLLRGFSLICLLTVGGCGIPTNSFEAPLADRGPIAVDQSNPFLAPNLYLSKEIDRSKTLKGFVELRGKPEAIEIETHYLAPVSLYFYYPGRNESYVLHPENRDWVILGPSPLSDQVRLKLSQLSQTEAAEPKADVPNVPPTSPEPAAEPKVSTRVDPPALRKEKVLKDLDMSRVRAAAAHPKPKPADTLPEPKAEAATDATKENPAETEFSPDATSGDVIHTVKFPGETLRIVTDWYTGDPENASRLARINGIDDPDVLVIGQVIRVPRYLIKHTDPMPASAVANYLNRLEKQTTE